MPSCCRVDSARPEPARLSALRRDAWRQALACALLLTLSATGVALALGIGLWFVARAVAVFGAGCAVMLQWLPTHAPHVRFGAANRVTLARLALASLLAALVGTMPTHDAHAAWGAIVVATTAALLDAVDGPLARAGGLASAFGARFDMECDALLVLVLSLLLLHFGKAGGWILAAGLMRYGFVLAAAAWPWLGRPLAPSLRRKTICVVQITLLIVCLGPVIPVVWSRAIAAAGLALLTLSFAIDVNWLARRRTSDAPSKPHPGAIGDDFAQ